MKEFIMKLWLNESDQFFSHDVIRRHINVKKSSKAVKGEKIKFTEFPNTEHFSHNANFTEEKIVFVLVEIEKKLLLKSC